MADHRFIYDGKGAPKREVCTEGTRVDILNEISEWANDSSSSSPPVFWLTGQAGSGKTTIAFTITKKFEKGQPTFLGANFLCSRQFRETRSLQRIVPTIAFQLARNCEPYRSALLGIDTSEAVHSCSVHEQVEKFLFRPWKQRKRVLSLPTYLVVVDALDEIEELERSTFLEAILKLIEANHITGLKFLITSRSDPDIVKLCKTFPPGAVCQLQNVPIEDAKLDIKTYLDIKLKDLHGTPEVKELNTQAAGLFIYAATVVKILTGRKLVRSEQLKRLRSLLSSSSTGFGTIDQLYSQIMRDAFADLDDDPELFSARLSVLHTFLCSIERISPFVAATLLDIDIEVARIVLDNLHAVLYVQDGLVYWYHSSFPDFILSQTRSTFRMDDKDCAFSCDAAAQHRILLDGCFRVMKSDDIGLRFNMGDIKSSYLLDREHAEELHENVDKNISPVLRYSCIQWAHHLCLSPEADDGNICSVLSDFLRIRVLFWIEAMNLLRSSGDCYYLLQNSGGWVSKVNPALSKDLQEAANFAMHFSGCPASDSTPHLYISSLATWQSTSTLSKSWKDEFPGIPTHTNPEGIVDFPLMTNRLGYLINSVAFSIDGTQVVVALSNGLLVLDATTGRQQHVLSREDFFLVKISRNGSRIVSVSLIDKGHGRISIWDTSTFQLVKEFDAVSGTISMEGTHILIIKYFDNYYQLQVLDISAGTLLRTLKMASTKDYIWESMAFSVAMNRFSIAFDESVEIWDISTGYATIMFTLEGHTSTISVTSISPDRKHVATCSTDRSARVWDSSTGNALMVLQHSGTVTALQFSSDSRHIVSGSLDGAIHVWDAITGAELKVFNTNATEGITSVAFSLDGTRIVSASEGLHVWSWDESAHVKRIHDGHDSEESKLFDARRNIVIDIAMTDDGKKIMSATHRAIQIWDAATRTELITIPSSLMFSAKISGNGEHIVSCLQDESIVVWDATTGDRLLHLNSTLTPKFDKLMSPFATALVTMSRSGGKFAVTREEPRRVEIWNIETGKDIEIAIDNFLSLLSFSNDGQLIVCGSVNGHFKTLSMVVYNALTGDAIQKMESEVVCGTLDFEGLFRSNGREVVVCSMFLSTHPTDTLFEVWDIASGKRLRVFKPLSYRHDNYGRFWMNCHSLSNDGKKFAAGCSDGFIRIWDVLEGAEVTVIGHSSAITKITFPRDDLAIISGSQDGTVCVWDLDGNNQNDWTLQESCWITSSREQGHKLMWVSDLLRVVQPRMTLITSHLEHGSINFKGAMIGEDWEKCYTPRNFASKEQ